LKNTGEKYMAVVITRHLGAVDWLIRHGFIKNDPNEDCVIDHATEADVRGQVVYGVLPLHLASKAACVWSIDIPNLPVNRRGTELSADDMDAFGAHCTRYYVQCIETRTSGAFKEESK
jgi:putative CRISPR-associated protein (TIGR02620 family)